MEKCTDPVENPIESVDNRGVSVENRSRRSGRPLGIDHGFEEFWRRYPVRLARLQAHRAYVVARREGATQEQLLEALARYIAMKPAGIAFCYAATWLRQHRWQDADPGDPGAPLSSRELTIAKSVMRKRQGVCHHTPACHNPLACLNAIAYELRGEARFRPW